MPIPHVTRESKDNGGHTYHIHDDDRINPSIALSGCTTLAGHADGSSPDGLMNWAVNLFQDTGNRMEFKESNKRAQEIGTNVHAEIEEYLVTGEVPYKASALFGAWFSTVNENGVDFLEQEKMVYNLDLMYGGTIDAIGYVDGKLTLFDWKTTDEYRQVRNRDTGVWEGKYSKKQFNQNVGYAAQIGGYIAALKFMASTVKTDIPTQAYIVYIFKDSLKTHWVKVNVNKAEALFVQSANLHKMTLGKGKGGLYGV